MTISIAENKIFRSFLRNFGTFLAVSVSASIVCFTGICASAAKDCVMTAFSELQENLRLGLAVVSEQWNYKAKNWVTSIDTTDIDDDGNIEILAGSRDGRIRVLNREGDLRWRRIIGNKTWVGTLVGIEAGKQANNAARIIVGTRDGNLYALDQHGKTVDREGNLYALDKNERPTEADKAAYWYHTDHVIRQVCYADAIIFGSEDRCVYALDPE